MGRARNCVMVCLLGCGPAAVEVELSIRQNAALTIASIELVTYRAQTRSGTLLRCSDQDRVTWRSSPEVTVASQPQVSDATEGSLRLLSDGAAVVIEALAYAEPGALGKVVASGCTEVAALGRTARVSAELVLEQVE